MRFLCFLLLTAPVWADRCAGDRHIALGEAAKDKPGDFPLNRMFLDGSVYERRAVRERYQREFEAYPDSLHAAYLYARSLVGSHTPEALKIYAQILAKDRIILGSICRNLPCRGVPRPRTSRKISCHTSLSREQGSSGMVCSPRRVSDSAVIGKSGRTMSSPK